MRKCLIIILLSNMCYVYSQEGNQKIDSIFISFFSYLKVNENDIYALNNDDSTCLYYEKTQAIVSFFENITGIYLKRELSSMGITVIYSDSVFKKWDEWYVENKLKLIWINDGKKINNPESKWFKCINYEDFYPSYIRFIGREDEIPKSNPPKYIQNLIESLHSPVDRRL